MAGEQAGPGAGSSGFRPAGARLADAGRAEHMPVDRQPGQRQRPGGCPVPIQHHPERHRPAGGGCRRRSRGNVPRNCLKRSRRNVRDRLWRDVEVRPQGEPQAGLSRAGARASAAGSQGALSRLPDLGPGITSGLWRLPGHHSLTLTNPGRRCPQRRSGSRRPMSAPRGNDVSQGRPPLCWMAFPGSAR
jgi:hypothetical protein